MPQTAADPRLGPRWTGERDCRGLRTILRGGERAGEKKPRLYCISQNILSQILTNHVIRITFQHEQSVNTAVLFLLHL